MKYLAALIALGTSAYLGALLGYAAGIATRQILDEFENFGEV
jgi:hypothetical protein